MLSGAIAVPTISLGQLNFIAQVVSMFFLVSYALINYATFYESRTTSPSFRPRFRRFSPWLSLAGFITCAGTILAIDIQSGIMAVFVFSAGRLMLLLAYLPMTPLVMADQEIDLEAAPDTEESAFRRAAKGSHP